MLDELTALLQGRTDALLKCVRERDWTVYENLCSQDITCFEPESQGMRVAGLDFHRFYFENGGHMGRHQDSICDFQVRRLGEDAALATYVRLVQVPHADGSAETKRYAETRVWQRLDGEWRHVHFHRSAD